MPTYSYKCPECGTAFDIVQAFTDDALTVCPNCGGKLRKVYSAIGVTFNGSGFYRTDSRSTGSGSGGANASAPASTTTPASATSTPSTSGSGSSGSSKSD